MTAVRDLLRALNQTKAPSEAELRRIVSSLEGDASASELVDLMVLLDSPAISTLLAAETRAELVSFLGGQNQADAVFKVLDLVPDLSALQLPESVPDKLSVDLQLVKSALLSPTLSPEQKQTRVFEFVMQYVRKFVELAEDPAAAAVPQRSGDVAENASGLPSKSASVAEGPVAKQLLQGEKGERPDPAKRAGLGPSKPNEPSSTEIPRGLAHDAPRDIAQGAQRERPAQPPPATSNSRSPFDTQELPRTEPPRTAAALTPEARERETARLGESVRASGVDTVLTTTQQSVSSIATELSQSLTLTELQQRVDQIPLPRPAPSSPAPRQAQVETPPSRRHVRGTDLRLGRNTLWNVLHRFRGTESEKSALDQDAWDRTVALGLLALLGLAVLITVLLTL